MFRFSVLMAALLVNMPSFYDALGKQTVSVTEALIHYLIAVPIVAVLFGLLRAAFKPTGTVGRKKKAKRPATAQDATAAPAA